MLTEERDPAAPPRHRNPRGRDRSSTSARWGSTRTAASPGPRRSALAEILRFDDIHDISKLAYQGDVVIIDYTSIANDAELGPTDEHRSEERREGRRRRRRGDREEPRLPDARRVPDRPARRSAPSSIVRHRGPRGRPMKIAIDRREALSSSLDVVVAGVAEDAPRRRKRSPGTLAPRTTRASGGPSSSRRWKRREIRGKRKEITVLHRPDGEGTDRARRARPLALGRRRGGPTRRGRGRPGASRERASARLGFRLASFVGRRASPAEAAAARPRRGRASSASYEFTRYRTTREAPIEEATIFLGEEHGRDESAIRTAVERSRSIAEVVLWTRDIANVPADDGDARAARRGGRRRSARSSASRSRSTTRRSSRRCTAAACSPSAGARATRPASSSSSTRAAPARGRRSPSSGKGITFDSGGHLDQAALADGRHEVRQVRRRARSSGSCGPRRASRSRRRVIGVLACAENLPGGSAYRPGDVVTHLLRQDDRGPQHRRRGAGRPRRRPRLRRRPVTTRTWSSTSRRSPARAWSRSATTSPASSRRTTRLAHAPPGRVGDARASRSGDCR